MQGLLPESQVLNLDLTVFLFPSSLESGWQEVGRVVQPPVERMWHTRQTWLEFGLEFQVKVIKTF